MIRSLLVLSTVFATASGSAQTAEAPLPEKKKTFSIEGQIVAATDGKGVFLNAGGPALKFHFEHFAVSVNMMPSLRFQEDGHKPFVTPVLGCGPQFYFLKEKRFIVSFPCYYYTSSQVWTFTAGVGYLLTTKKK